MSSEINLINVESSTYVNIPEPLGILQLAANLEKNNFKVKVLDMSVDKRSVKNFFDSDLIGLSFSTPNVLKTKEIIKEIRSYNPNAKIIFVNIIPIKIFHGF